MVANFAGKNSFLTNAVARFRRVKFIRMARIQEQLSVFSHDERVVAANSIRPRRFCIAGETLQFKSIVMDFIWAVARPNGSNQDVQQVIFLNADQLSLSYIGYRCECCALMSFGRAECHAVA